MNLNPNITSICDKSTAPLDINVTIDFILRVPRSMNVTLELFGNGGMSYSGLRSIYGVASVGSSIVLKSSYGTSRYFYPTGNFDESILNIPVCTMNIICSTPFFTGHNGTLLNITMYSSVNLTVLDGLEFVAPITFQFTNYSIYSVYSLDTVKVVDQNTSKLVKFIETGIYFFEDIPTCNNYLFNGTIGKLTNPNLFVEEEETNNVVKYAVKTRARPSSSSLSALPFGLETFVYNQTTLTTATSTSIAQEYISIKATLFINLTLFTGVHAFVTLVFLTILFVKLYKRKFKKKKKVQHRMSDE